MRRAAIASPMPRVLQPAPFPPTPSKCGGAGGYLCSAEAAIPTRPAEASAQKGSLHARRTYWGAEFVVIR